MGTQQEMCNTARRREPIHRIQSENITFEQCARSVVILPTILELVVVGHVAIKTNRLITQTESESAAAE